MAVDTGIEDGDRDASTREPVGVVHDVGVDLEHGVGEGCLYRTVEVDALDGRATPQRAETAWRDGRRERRQVLVAMHDANIVGVGGCERTRLRVSQRRSLCRGVVRASPDGDGDDDAGGSAGADGALDLGRDGRGQRRARAARHAGEQCRDDQSARRGGRPPPWGARRPPWLGFAASRRRREGRRRC